MPKMSKGFKDRIRDAGPRTDRTTVKTHNETWEGWISQLRFQAELDEVRSRPQRTLAAARGARRG